MTPLYRAVHFASETVVQGWDGLCWTSLRTFTGADHAASGAALVVRMEAAEVTSAAAAATEGGLAETDGLSADPFTADPVGYARVLDALDRFECPWAAPTASACSAAAVGARWDADVCPVHHPVCDVHLIACSADGVCPTCAQWEAAADEQHIGPNLPPAVDHHACTHSAKRWAVDHDGVECLDCGTFPSADELEALGIDSTLRWQ